MTPKDVFTRRDALTILAAITGAVTLASLPKTWQTPVVEVGALPAHAQVSGGLLTKIDDQFAPSTICGEYLEWHARISYNLPAGGEALPYQIEFSGGTGGEAVLLFIEGDGGGPTGELELIFCLYFGTHTQATLELWAIDGRGFETNHLIYYLTRPEPNAEPDRRESTTERLTGSGKF